MKKICSVLFMPLLMILLLVVPVKGASEWEEFKTLRGNVYSLKTGIKYTTNAIAQVWVKTVYSDIGRERQIQYMKKQGLSTEKEWLKLSDRLSLVEVDCKQEKIRVLYLTYYDADGGILHNQSSSEAEWRSIVKDSTFDVLRKKVCK